MTKLGTFTVLYVIDKKTYIASGCSLLPWAKQRSGVNSILSQTLHLHGNSSETQVFFNNSQKRFLKHTLSVIFYFFFHRPFVALFNRQCWLRKVRVVYLLTAKPTYNCFVCSFFRNRFVVVASKQSFPSKQCLEFIKFWCGPRLRHGFILMLQGIFYFIIMLADCFPNSPESTCY